MNANEQLSSDKHATAIPLVEANATPKATRTSPPHKDEDIALAATPAVGPVLAQGCTQADAVAAVAPCSSPADGPIALEPVPQVADASNGQTTVRTRTIEIDGMKGDACVSKVSAALKAIKGPVVYSVAMGNATLRSATLDEARSACVAVRLAGYECRETQPASLAM